MSKRFNLLFTFLIFSLFIITSCANPTAPTGGPKDETPPKVVEDKSTANFQTNFRPEAIELTFDEWVKLQNAATQVIISPPFDGYKVRLKGKSVIIDFGDKDTLRNNVTYVIQFGEAIKDLSESNPTENLRFVFSTGPQIDSLEVNGQVLDAYTAEPVEKALVLLYDNLADTVFRTERPLYFGRTGEDGQFKISNMREGAYKICALVDGDGNYKFSQVNEKIAFFEETINVSEDTSLNLNLKLFQEETPLQLLETDSSAKGLVKLVFNQPAEAFLEIQSETTFLQSFEKDTAFLWHQSIVPSTVYLSSDTSFYDTISVPQSGSGQSFEKIDFYKIPGQGLNPNPIKDFALGINSPVSSLDTAKIKFLADTLLSTLSFEWKIDSIEPRKLFVSHPYKENTKYKWSALPGAFTNLWGHLNTDTLEIEWTTSERKRFGNLLIRFTTTDPALFYVVKLVQEGKDPVQVFRLSGATAYNQNVQGLPSGDYQLEIIYDENNNGRWDTGHFDSQRQPEKVVIRSLEKLRPNWDLEVDVELEKN